jgi:iron(III) transport system permease protein
VALLRRRWDALPLLGAGALAAYLALVPIGYLVWQAFEVDGGMGLDNFRSAYAVDGLGTMTVNSLVFAVGSAGFALVAGTSLAFLVTRTDMPLRRLYFAAAVMPLVFPGVLYTIAWIFLSGPRSGALSEVLPFDAFGMDGMVAVEAMGLAPLVFLLMAAAFSSMDPALEEAALTSGADRLTVLRRVTLPLVRPALYAGLLISVVRALEAFEVPALLGVPDGTYVFTSRAWKALDSFPAQIGDAAAYALPLLAVTAAGVALYSRTNRRVGRLAAVTGSGGSRPRRWDLGRWRLPATLIAGAYLALTTLAPLLVLIYTSTQRFYSTPSLDGLSNATGRNYGDLFTQGSIGTATLNSVLLSVAAATAVMLVMAVVAWMLIRSRVRGRWVLDGVVSVPLVVPGVVLGLALLVFYLRVPLPIYGTLWILLIAYCTRFMPYGLRFASAVLSQLGEEVEEAARTSGASWAQTFRRVTLPLLAPGLVAGWIYVVIASMRELSASILLTSPGTEVLPVRIFALYEGGDLPELAALGVVLTVVLAGLSVAAWRLGTRVGAPR